MRVRLNPANPASRGLGDLTEGNSYRVIGIEANDFRIMNDEGQPYLYPASLFRVIDPSEPREWRTRYGPDKERYSYPPRLGVPGFFEDVFDGNREAVAVLRKYLAQDRAKPMAAPGKRQSSRGRRGLARRNR